MRKLIHSFLKNAFLLSLTTCFFVLSGCFTQKTVSYTTQSNFSDDLSKYRVVFKEGNSQETANSTKEQTQNTTSAITNLKPPVSSINVGLDTLLAQISENNKHVTIKGYRLQVFSGMLRKDAENVVAELRNLIPYTGEIEYVQPNFKVKVGNFQNKIDAYQTYYKIKEVFPNVVVMYEKIKIPRYK
jgi:hypothetical protein